MNNKFLTSLLIIMFLFSFNIKAFAGFPTIELPGPISIQKLLNAYKRYEKLKQSLKKDMGQLIQSENFSKFTAENMFGEEGGELYKAYQNVKSDVDKVTNAKNELEDKIKEEVANIENKLNTELNNLRDKLPDGELPKGLKKIKNLGDNSDIKDKYLKMKKYIDTENGEIKAMKVFSAFGDTENIEDAKMVYSLFDKNSWKEAFKMDNYGDLDKSIENQIEGGEDSFNDTITNMGLEPIPKNNNDNTNNNDNDMETTTSEGVNTTSKEETTGIKMKDISNNFSESTQRVKEIRKENAKKTQLSILYQEYANNYQKWFYNSNQDKWTKRKSFDGEGNEQGDGTIDKIKHMEKQINRTGKLLAEKEGNIMPSKYQMLMLVSMNRQNKLTSRTNKMIADQNRLLKEAILSYLAEKTNKNLEDLR